jgi:prepilin signal peptidase PulO-like enzyme (type II secretory pathway)
MAVAGAIGLAGGWVFPGYQHNLYSEPEFRNEPTGGTKLLLLRIFCAVAGAATFALAFRDDHYDFGSTLLSAAFLAVLIALSSTDLDRARIPNKLTYPAAVLALLFCWTWPDRSVLVIGLGFVQALSASVLLLFLRFKLGDVKLAILIGLILGWRLALWGYMYGVLLGGLVSVGFLLLHGPRRWFSYGPYLAAGAAVMILFPGIAS